MDTLARLQILHGFAVAGYREKRNMRLSGGLHMSAVLLMSSLLLPVYLMCPPCLL